MQRIALCIGVLLLPLAAGCGKKTTAVTQETLEPTRRELYILETFRLDPESERGQKKIQQIRRRQEKIQASRDRVTGWVEEHQRRQLAQSRRNEPRPVDPLDYGLLEWGSVNIPSQDGRADRWTDPGTGDHW